LATPRSAWRALRGGALEPGRCPRSIGRDKAGRCPRARRGVRLSPRHVRSPARVARCARRHVQACLPSRRGATSQVTRCWRTAEPSARGSAGPAPAWRRCRSSLALPPGTEPWVICLSTGLRLITAPGVRPAQVRDWPCTEGHLHDSCLPSAVAGRPWRGLGARPGHPRSPHRRAPAAVTATHHVPPKNGTAPVSR